MFASSMTRRPTTSTLFPYTTLFRSHRRVLQELRTATDNAIRKAGGAGSTTLKQWLIREIKRVLDVICKQLNTEGDDLRKMVRSEEHTSELQSLTNLVCRLLLEKKKK